MSTGNNDAPEKTAPPPTPIPIGRSDQLVTEVTQKVAGRMDNDEEIMGSESTTASLSTSRSPEPLSIRPLAVFYNIRQPNDTSTSAGNSQTAALAQDTGNIPTIIRDTLPVPFTEEHLRNFRHHFSIPSFVDMRLSRKGDQVYEHVLDPD
ncbi:hypothetical protein LIER_25404 [Lithospermum erythrorhizon]|uniref:Uncharacterized protein n=1 Tax=Lithospermum erythrorhizon TaxID=34254 RepID=A0AAV3R5X9_LITER